MRMLTLILALVLAPLLHADTCPSGTFTASRTAISPGDRVTLSWSNIGAAVVNVMPGHEGLPRAGTLTLRPSHSTEYTLILINQTCTKTYKLTVEVKESQ